MSGDGEDGDFLGFSVNKQAFVNLFETWVMAARAQSRQKHHFLDFLATPCHSPFPMAFPALMRMRSKPRQRRRRGLSGAWGAALLAAARRQRFVCFTLVKPFQSKGIDLIAATPLRIRGRGFARALQRGVLEICCIPTGVFARQKGDVWNRPEELGQSPMFIGDLVGNPAKAIVNDDFQTGDITAKETRRAARQGRRRLRMKGLNKHGVRTFHRIRAMRNSRLKGIGQDKIVLSESFLLSSGAIPF